MVKRVFIFLSCVLFLSLFLGHGIAQTDDISGWNGTKWGMSKIEIMELFKGEIVKLEKKETYSHARYAEFGLNNYKIGNSYYDIRFLMDSTGILSQVNIKPGTLIGVLPSGERLERNKNNLGVVASRDDYNKLEKLLFEKYGNWFYQKSERLKITTTWEFPSTTIELNFSDLGYPLPTMVILTYKPRGTVEKKL
jgi:hypothetical protein